VIPKITKGNGLRRLLHYLWGPGEHNEHMNPHLVAGYSSDLVALEPRIDDVGRRDIATLLAKMSAPLVAASAAGERLPDPSVWQCSLSLRHDEKELGDQRWREIAEAFVEEMGFTGRPAGDDCRWIAMHHGRSKNGNDHIHVVVVLVTDSGVRVSFHNDFPRAQQAARLLEQRFGLQQVAVRDGTTGRQEVRRAEFGIAARHGDTEPDRVWLRNRVRAAAAGAGSEVEFLANLRRSGVAVKIRVDAGDASRVTGFAVARPHPDRDLVFFSGSKLDGQLSLPKLRTRWPGTEVAAQQWEQAAAAVLPPPGRNARRWTEAAERVDALTRKVTGLPANPTDVQQIAEGAADLLARLSTVAEPDSHADLARAADAFARASVPRRGPRPRPSRHGLTARQDLAVVTAMLAATSRPRDRSQLLALVLLMAATTRLIKALADLHDATGRRAAAGAAMSAYQRLVPLLEAARAQGMRTSPVPGAAQRRTRGRSGDVRRDVGRGRRVKGE